MKFRLKTRDKIAEEKKAKKRVARERREMINSFPRTKREKANAMLDELELLHKTMNRWGIYSFFFIALFFVSFGTGYVRVHTIFWVLAGIGIIGFAYTIGKTLICSHRADKQKKKFRTFWLESQSKRKEVEE
ncbi:MAG: hypothetical protein KAV48_05450 [Methanomicrobia archaeon]|nr:hypothetical protein [Methanomicrobia archaeon]MCK4433362.1 hypothetical protein [Methanomicrobia archaeon]